MLLLIYNEGSLQTFKCERLLMLKLVKKKNKRNVTYFVSERNIIGTTYKHPKKEKYLIFCLQI